MSSFTFRTAHVLLALALVTAVVLGILSLSNALAQDDVPPLPTPTPAPPEAPPIPPAPTPTPIPPDQTTLPTATPVPPGPPGGEETEDDETTNRGIVTPHITISRVRPSVTEGDEVRFAITADVAYSGTLNVNVEVTEDGSFLTGTIPSVITIASGTRTSDLILETDDDGTEEDHGWVHAKIKSGSNYLLGNTTTSSMRVWDNDTPVTPALSIEPYITPVEEGSNAIFRITADAAPSSLLYINVGAVQSGSFFDGTPVTEITMDAASRQTFYIIATSNDDVDEPHGSITASIKPGTGYTVKNDASFATIDVEDNEDPPVITISPLTGTVTEGDYIYFTVTASPPPENRLPLKVGATETGNFLGNVTTEIAFAEDETFIYYILPTIQDDVDEPDGVVTAEIKPHAGYTVGSPNRANVTVEDDDFSPPGQPDKPDVTPGDGFIQVGWIDPSYDGGSLITKYQFQFKRSSVTTWSRAVDIFGNNNKLSGLINGYSYDVRVNACNQPKGCGLWSDAATATPVNEPPEIDYLGPRDFPENSNHSVAAYTAYDPEGTSVTWSLEGVDRGRFTITPAGGVLSFRHAPNYEAPLDTGRDNTYKITVVATDDSSQRQEDTLDVTVNVLDVNESPFAIRSFDNPTMDIGDALNITLSDHFSDPDANDTLNYSAEEEDTRVATAAAASGVLTVTAVAGGDTTITVTAYDANRLSASQTFTVTVEAIPPPPTVTIARHTDIDNGNH